MIAPESFAVAAGRYGYIIEQETARFRLPWGDDDDLRQEALIGLWKAMQDYRPALGSFAGFARLCVKRQVITALKTATRQKHEHLNRSASLSAPLGDDEGLTLGDIVSNQEAEVADALDSRDEVRRLVRSITAGGLSWLEERALVGFALEGRTYAEMATEHRTSRKGIDNAIQRAKKNWRAWTAPRLAVA